MTMFSLILAAGLAVGQPVAAQKPVEPTTEAPAKANAQRMVFSNVFMDGHP